MPRVMCNTDGCPNQGSQTVVGKIRYVFDEKRGELVPSIIDRCYECNKKMEQVPNKEVPKVNVFAINKFDGLSNNEKRKVIKKRAASHFQKHDKGDLANYKNKIIKDNKNRAEGK